MPKRLALLVLLVAAIGCSPVAEQEAPELRIATRESMAVVRTVLARDGYTLPSEGPDGRPVAVLLAPIHFTSVLAPGQVPPPPPPVGYFGISIRVLYALNARPGTSFTPQDSVMVAQQAAAVQGAALDTTLFASGDLLRPAAQAAKKALTYYAFSHPVFSRDSARAYIAVDSVCPDCGGGTGYFLRKKGTAWEVEDVIKRWMN